MGLADFFAAPYELWAGVCIHFLAHNTTVQYAIVNIFLKILGTQIHH